MTQGIYQIENLINHKKYIGQSTHIEARFSAHRKNYHNHMDGSPLLYKAFDKYGIENFAFSILELVKDKNLLDEKETFYILSLNTLSPNGYNCILPTENWRGEYNLKNKLSFIQIKEIQNLLINTKKPIQQIAVEYDVAFSTIYRINKGEIWSQVDLNYPLRKTNDLGRPGSQNGRSNFTEDEVLFIRQLYVNQSIPDLYLLYQDRCSLSGFKKIVQGATFKNVPIYKKQEKRWIYPK